jgi:hypothetical protein
MKIKTVKTVLFSIILTTLFSAVLLFSACPAEFFHPGEERNNNSSNLKTPVASDFNITGLSQIFNGEQKRVYITPKAGKSNGAITIYYDRSAAAPSTVGSYPVTFNVAAASGWKAASGLSAGTLVITSSPIAVTDVSLNKTTLSIIVGASETLTATVAPADATNKNVTWSSSNSNVATVSNGTVTAVAAGTATITVTTQDGNKTTNCSVNVSILTTTGLVSYLASLPDNTVSFPHNITLKVSNTSEFATIRTALLGAPYKYVNLDLTGSTITTIPDNAFYIGDPLYTGCGTLTGITIPNGVTSIGVSAFSDCSGLTSVTIPNSVTSIGVRAFEDCYSLTSVTIPDSVTNIGDGVFEYCNSLASVTIPDSVTSIGDRAFYGCESLASITIPNSVTSIGDRAFYGCGSLVSITIPNSVTSIGDYAFSFCKSLIEINIGSSNNRFSSENGVFYNKNKTTLISYPAGNTANSFSIPNSVTSIMDGAFADCDNLTSVTIPYGVTSIRYITFAWCDNLVSVTIPNSVTGIGQAAFADCTSLTSITIPDSVTGFHYNVFEGCNSLLTINISSGNIWYSSENGVLYDKNKTTLIAYPGGKTGAFTIPNSVTRITYSAFAECENLTSVTIPNSVTSIDPITFRGCESLTSVIIGNGVISIGWQAFNSRNLTSVTFQGTIPSSGFSTENGGVFHGDLRDKFYALNPSNGTPGTYTRPSGGETWTRQ